MSTSMTVRCRSIALSKLRSQLDLGRRPRPAHSTSSANASLVTGSISFQAGVRTKAKRGGSGGSLAAVGDERRARDAAACRGPLVEAGKHLGKQRGVLDRAREHADMIERARQHQRTGARDQAVRRLEADHAAERRRPDDRAVGLRADRAAAPCRPRRPPPSRSTSRRACARGRAGCGSCPGGNRRTPWSRSCP